MNDFRYGDKVMDNAMEAATGWLDRDEAARAVNTAITALNKVSDYIAQADVTNMKPEIAARTLAHIAKMIDEVARLVEFSRGKPDSRPAPGLGELLPYLTNEQFDTLSKWIEEGQQRGSIGSRGKLTQWTPTTISNGAPQAIDTSQYGRCGQPPRGVRVQHGIMTLIGSGLELEGWRTPVRRGLRRRYRRGHRPKGCVVKPCRFIHGVPVDCRADD